MTAHDYELDPQSAEPPLLAFVREYWQRKRGAQAMPSRKDIAPADMKTHLPHILLADVVEGGRDFRYRLVGSQLQAYFAGNPTGALMTDILAPFGADTIRQTLNIYRTVVTRRAPLRVRGAGSYYAQVPKLFDALLTPLSDDGVEPSMIFGAFLFAWDRNLEFARPRPAKPGEAELEDVLAGE